MVKELYSKQVLKWNQILLHNMSWITGIDTRIGWLLITQQGNYDYFRHTYVIGCDIFAIVTEFLTTKANDNDS